MSNIFKDPPHLDVVVDRYLRRMGNKKIPGEAPQFCPQWVECIDLPQSRCYGSSVSFTDKKDIVTLKRKITLLNAKTSANVEKQVTEIHIHVYIQERTKHGHFQSCWCPSMWMSSSINVNNFTYHEIRHQIFSSDEPAIDLLHNQVFWTQHVWHQITQLNLKFFFNVCKGMTP